jgi:hypothetical protein
MIDHTGIGVADVARSAAFYDAALGALGLLPRTTVRMALAMVSSIRSSGSTVSIRTA